MNSKNHKNVHVDDLKRIGGIGAGLEKRLNAKGIFTYEQIAALSTGELVSCLDNVIGLTTNRIEKQNWIGQAHKLAAEEKSLPVDNPTEKTLGGHSPRATFTIELLLNKDNEVRGTTITHCQTKKEKNWPGWHQDQLIDFMASTGELKLDTPSPISLIPLEPYPNPEPLDLIGTPHVNKLVAMLPDEETTCHLLDSTQNFDISLEIDMADVKVSPKTLLDSSVTIYAKQLGNKGRKLLGQAQGSATRSHPLKIRLTNKKLSEGIYRLETVLVLACKKEDMLPQQVEMVLQGDLLSIYSMDYHPIMHRS